MSSRISVLDGLRGISILLVLAAHMLPLGPKQWELNYAAGAMGMSLFFALSGFLITSALLENGNVTEFLIKRAARILPLSYLYIWTVLLIAVFAPVAALMSSLFVVNYATQYMVGLNNHFWSLCVEVQFYIAIAMTVLIGGRKALWLVFPACLLITLLRFEAGEVIAIQTHFRVDEILVGACVALLFRASPWRAPPLVATVATALSLSIWFLASSPYTESLQYFRPYGCALFFAACLSHRETWISDLLSSRPLRYIATISYALYIVHPLTYQGWLNTGSVYERYLFKRPISFVLAFSAAHLSTFYWERHWTRKARIWIEYRRSKVRLFAA